MDIKLIGEIKNALINPKKNVLELNRLHKQLFNVGINVNCSDCVRDAVRMFNIWLRKQDEQRVYSNDVDIPNEINLFVQVYQQENKDRQKELDVCLELNYHNHFITNIIEIEDRLTYREIFDMTADYPNGINIIANSDIYFNETIGWTKFMDNNSCYSLSRWDYIGRNLCVLFDRKDSQDVWIFKGKVHESIKGNFTLGIAGCDNKIAYEINGAGYKILNPSKTIHAIHLHESNHRTYTGADRLHPPFHFIFPHHL